MAFTRRETAILILGDFLILMVSLWAALILRNLALPSLSYFEANFLPFIPVFLLSLIVFYVAGLYEKQTRIVRREMGERILGAQIANVIIAALIFFILPLTIAPKTILLIYLIVSVVAVSLWRFYRSRRVLATEGRVRAVLVASGKAADELAEEIGNNDRYSVLFVSRVSPIDSTDILAEIRAALEQKVRGIVIDTRDPRVAPVLPALQNLMLGGTLFLDFSAFYEDVFDRVPLDHINHAWVLESLPKGRTLYDTAKRALDLIFGLLGLIIAAPFILIAAIILKFSGAAFITSERVGRGGATFKLYKLRTMLINDHGDPELRKQNRVTGFGSFLRKSRIDELPQLLNVLTGDLSFIGPRPELPKIAAVYEEEIPYYRVRSLIPPGLSGWAQIRDYDAPKGGADVERTRRKLSYDSFYLKRRSFGLDLAIMLKTLRALATFTGK